MRTDSGAYAARWDCISVKVTDRTMKIRGAKRPSGKSISPRVLFMTICARARISAWSNLTVPIPTLKLSATASCVQCSRQSSEFSSAARNYNGTTAPSGRSWSSPRMVTDRAGLFYWRGNPPGVPDMAEYGGCGRSAENSGGCGDENAI